MSDEMMMVSKVMHVAYVSDSEDIPLVGRLPLVARRYKAWKDYRVDQHFFIKNISTY